MPTPRQATATFKDNLDYDHEIDLKKKKKIAEEMQETTCNLIEKKLQRDNKDGYEVTVWNRKCDVTGNKTTSTVNVSFSKENFPTQETTVTQTREFDPKTGLISKSIKPSELMDMKKCYALMAEDELTIRLENKRSQAEFKPRVIAVTVDDPRGEIIDRNITVNGKVMLIKDISEKQANALEAFLTTFDAVEFNGTMYISPKPQATTSHMPSGLGFHDPASVTTSPASTPSGSPADSNVPDFPVNRR